MILQEYTKEINTSEWPKSTAKRIACKLNMEDPFNGYTVLYTMTWGYVIEKFEIKGMKNDL